MKHGITPELRAMVESDPFAAAIGADLLELEPGRAKFGLKLRGEHLNFMGMVHGGVIFSLADFAFAAASNSFGSKAVALSVGIDFLAAPEAGGELTAEVRQESRAGRMGYYSMVVTDVAGKTIARCRGWAYHTGKPHVDSGEG